MQGIIHKASAALVAFGVVLATIGASGSALASTTPHTMGATASRAGAPTLPQTSAADRAARWLASTVNGLGFVGPTSSPDLSDTTLTILALAATKVDVSVARRALRYVERHVETYVSVEGADGPGQLATLILDARALGADPRSFGGTNLVHRLLMTMRTTGHDTGLFGVQDPTYDGAYRQGLALMALGAINDRSASVVGPAVKWLKRQECANGGWESYRSSTATACAKPNPSTYSGEDTNSTALAILGLTAQRAAFGVSPVHFLATLETATGGWGYYGGSADPDSTALVLQAIVALHDSVSTSPFAKGNNDGVSALLRFRVANGAFYYPGSHTASGLSTEQAVPALVGNLT